MTSPAKASRATVIPGLRYRDARAAIEFLCDAFGFEKGLIVDGPNGTIAHAQLTFGNGMIMLGSHPHEGEYGEWVRPPEAPALINMQGIYVVVSDPDAHFARARTAGGAENSDEAHRSRLWRPRLHGARYRRPCVDIRHLRSVG